MEAVLNTRYLLANAISWLVMIVAANFAWRRTRLRVFGLALLVPSNHRAGRMPAPPHRTQGSRVLAGCLLLFPCAICTYASFVEPNRLQLEQARLELPGLSLQRPLRVAILADIQTTRVGAHEQRAAQMAMEQQPDLIPLPGDFLQCRGPAHQRAAPAFRELMRSLRAPLGIYAVLGDVDRIEPTRSLFRDTGVVLLVNEVISTRSASGPVIAIGGIELNYRTSAAAATAEQLSRIPAAIRILMGHRPDAVALVRQIKNLGAGNERNLIDVVVAGHTHGGQVVIPGFGPVLTLSGVPRHVAAGGLHHVEGQPVYVSRGVGLERAPAPPIRLFCPPEVSLIELTGAPVTTGRH